MTNRQLYHQPNKPVLLGKSRKYFGITAYGDQRFVQVSTITDGQHPAPETRLKACRQHKQQELHQRVGAAGGRLGLSTEHAEAEWEGMVKEGTAHATRLFCGVESLDFDQIIEFTEENQRKVDEAMASTLEWMTELVARRERGLKHWWAKLEADLFAPKSSSGRNQPPPPPLRTPSSTGGPDWTGLLFVGMAPSKVWWERCAAKAAARKLDLGHAERIAHKLALTGARGRRLALPPGARDGKH